MMIKKHIAKLTFPEARELAEFAAVFQDLEFVVQVTQKLAEMLRNGSADVVLVRSLFTAALVAYVRCFTNGKRALLSPDIFSVLPGEPLICHQQYKDTRDKHIAHSVNPFEEMTVGAILSGPESANREVEGVASFMSSLSSYDAEGVEQFGRLAKFAQNHVSIKCKELELRVLEIAKTLDLDELYKSNGLRITPQGGPDAARMARAT